MTKKQMMALKPGDIVMEIATGDQYSVVRLQDLYGFVSDETKWKLTIIGKEIVAEKIPGFKYIRSYSTGPYFYFRHKRIAVKEAAK